jgi:hypothetical protein
MFIVDWVCERGHVFEGWYDSAQALAAMREAGEVISCPQCGSVHLERQPTFASIGRTTTRAADATSMETTAPAIAMPIELQRLYSQLLKHARANSTDVGDQFATTALAMHRGEQEHAPIMGQSTADETRMLRDEGVEFVSIPVPDIDDN